MVASLQPQPTVRRGFEVARSHSYASIEATAARWRQKLAPGLAIHEPFPAAQVFEAPPLLRVAVGRERFIMKMLDLEWMPDHHDGMAWVDRDRGQVRVALSERAADELRAGHPRSAFTLAHEIGHGVLHAADLIRLSGSSAELEAALGTLTHAAHCDSEWQANAFAGALLMPAQGVVDGMTAADIAGVYGVSVEAAEVRLRTLVKLAA